VWVWGGVPPRGDYAGWAPRRSVSVSIVQTGIVALHASRSLSIMPVAARIGQCRSRHGLPACRLAAQPQCALHIPRYPRVPSATRNCSMPLPPATHGSSHFPREARRLEAMARGTLNETRLSTPTRPLPRSCFLNALIDRPPPGSVLPALHIWACASKPMHGPCCKGDTWPLRHGRHMALAAWATYGMGQPRRDGYATGW
jgi:hypothetical protein